MHKHWSRNKYILCGALLALLIAVPIILRSSPYMVHIFCLMFYYIIYSCSLYMIFSVGELSLAHAAFVGIGAYTSTLLMMKLNLSFWLALPTAAIASAMAALPIGYLTLRLKGMYFILVTLAFAEIVRVILSNFWIDVLGGIPGITNIPHPSITALSIDFSSKAHFYYLGLALVIISFLVMCRIEKSRIGLVFSSIRECENLAESVGINRMKHKKIAFVIGCFFASIAGSFYAHFVGIITPDDFALHGMLLPAAYMIIGGVGSIFGPLIGTIVMTSLSYFALKELAAFEMLAYGIIVILVLLFLPQGLISIPQRISSVARYKSKSEA